MSNSFKILTHGGRALVRYRPLRRSRVNRISEKRRTDQREYIRLKKWFLAQNPWCAWGLAQEPPQRIRATELHHARGRGNGLYLNEKFFVAVSARGHRWIHDNPEAARKLGLICPKGCWGVNE